MKKDFLTLISFHDFFTLEEGDTVFIKVCDELLESKVLGKPFWNSDADDPDWEIETSNGFSDMYSLLVRADFSNPAPKGVEYMNYSDFYDIAKYGNENWKGCFSQKEIAENAYDYLCEFNASKENGEPTETIKELAKLLAEDGGEECHDWLYEMTKGLGLFDMDAADYEETDEKLVRRFLEERVRPIIFEIKTSDGFQPFFMYITSKTSIEAQIHNALAEICFCDNYDIIGYKDADEEYVNKRELLCKKYEELMGISVEDAFCSGKYTALSSIKKDLGWRLDFQPPKM